MKIGLPKRKLVFQPPFFRCYVSFREGIQLIDRYLWKNNYIYTMQKNHQHHPPKKKKTAPKRGSPTWKRRPPPRVNSPRASDRGVVMIPTWDVFQKPCKSWGFQLPTSLNLVSCFPDFWLPSTVSHMLQETFCVYLPAWMAYVNLW